MSTAPGCGGAAGDTREEALDLVEHARLVALPRQVVDAGQLGDPRAGQALAHVAAGVAQVLALAVDHERRDAHAARSTGRTSISSFMSVIAATADGLAPREM